MNYNTKSIRVNICKNCLLVSVDDALVGEEASAGGLPPRDKNEEVPEGLFGTGFGTVGRVHSRTVNGRANDLNCMINLDSLI